MNVIEHGKIVIRETSESGSLFMQAEIRSNLRESRTRSKESIEILSRLEFASFGETPIECERASESEVRHYRETRDSHSLSRFERAALVRDYRESRSLGLIIEGVLRD